MRFCETIASSGASAEKGEQRRSKCTALSFVAINHLEELVVVQRLVLRNALAVGAFDAVLFLCTQEKRHMFHDANITR
jgi:hypothetical protein